MDVPAVELTSLQRTFSTRSGDVTAVSHVDLTIQRGEVVALLGPNGAGKTTTLDMVLGLIEPTAGRVQVLGLDPRVAVTSGRVSAVLQTGGLLPDVSVRETVEVIASMFDHHAPVEDVLIRAGLDELADRRVSKCSGGEQQRLRFALALLPRPDLLILDEPTAGMDVAARRDFWQTMHAEASAGRTVIFATHYLEEAESFADRIVLMSKGQIVADDSTANIRARASGRVVSATVPSPDRAAEHLRDLVSSIEVADRRITVRTGDSDAVAVRLLTQLSGRDLEIRSGSLEDAFVALTEAAR